MAFTSNISPHSAMNSFSSSFKGDLVLPSDPTFSQAIKRWSVTAERNAAIVALVKDDKDVALALHYAKENNLSIAVRGGGHNPAGASSAEGGLVIDLSKYINSVRVDPTEKIAYVGGGALWAAVDKEAIKHGLAAVASTVNDVGVGGVTLAGGYGWLTGSHGLALDNLVQATIVTAAGDTIVANESSNSDLFWGIRGGGCNFGVVTEFILRLHPQRATVYAGPLFFMPSQAEQVAHATAVWYENVDDKAAMKEVATVGPDGNPAIICLVFYNGSESEGRYAFKPLLDLGPVADFSKEIPYEFLNEMQNQHVPHGFGRYYKGLAPRQPAYKNLATTLQRAVEITKSPSSGGVQPVVTFDYVPLRKVNSVPSDATPFPRGVSTNILFLLSWAGDKNGELFEGKSRLQIAREISNDLAEVVSRGCEDVSLGYVNNDTEGVGTQDKAKAVFGSNYQRLQKIKRQWDPENIFNKWLPIAPAEA